MHGERVAGRTQGSFLGPLRVRARKQYSGNGDEHHAEKHQRSAPAEQVGEQAADQRAE